MRVLLVSGDASRAETLGREVCQRTGAPAWDVVTSVAEAVARLADREFDGCVIDMAQPVSTTAGSPTSQLRQPASHLALVVIVGSTEQAVEAIGAGADATVRVAPRLSEAVMDALTSARVRRKLVPLARLRVLFVTDTDAVRDPAFMLRVNIEKVAPEPGRAMLPAPYDQGPLPYDAFVVDMTGGAMEQVEVLQDVVARGAGQPVIVLADATDRTVATVAMRLGALQVIDKNGAWPLRLLSALDQTTAARRTAAELSSLQSSYARQRQILDGLPIGVALIIPDGTILAMNPAGLGVAGLETFSPMNLLDRVPATDRTTAAAWLHGVATGTPQAIQLRWGTNGNAPVLALNGAPLPVGREGSIVLATIAATPL